jgi:hypothetical protein
VVLAAAYKIIYYAVNAGVGVGAGVVLAAAYKIIYYAVNAGVGVGAGVVLAAAYKIIYYAVNVGVGVGAGVGIGAGVVLAAAYKIIYYAVNAGAGVGFGLIVEVIYSSSLVNSYIISRPATISFPLIDTSPVKFVSFAFIDIVLYEASPFLYLPKISKLSYVARIYPSSNIIILSRAILIAFTF